MRVLENVMLPTSMVCVQVFTMGALLLSKVALNTGMHPFVLLGYRNIIGALTVAPFALIFEREMLRQVTPLVCLWISVNAAFGVVLAMGLYYYGLRATNAAYSVNFLNLIPIVTFVIAVILRVERLVLRSFPSSMKILGTLLCVGGTTVVSLYKGKLLHLWPSHLLKQHAHAAGAVSHHDMLGGTLFLCGSCLSYAFWFIVQVRVFRVFPSNYMATTLTCLSGSVQAVLIGIVINRDRSTWALSWDLKLLTVVYSGVFNTGVTFCLISWAISRRGPIYPSMFNSLSLIITTVLDSVLLGTDTSVGSILGTMLIITGLYAFLWGKGRELRQSAETQSVEPSAERSTDQRRDTENGEEIENGRQELQMRLEIR